MALGLAASVMPHPAQAGMGDTVVDAREAFRKKDRARLAAARAQAAAETNPLASWVDYWELTGRIGEVQSDEVAAFYARWPNSYVEDRFRNDWLLELGKRRDWRNFAQQYPLFKMNDDREVSCYALLVDYLAGKDVRAAAIDAWLAQRDADTGCAMLAASLLDGQQFTTQDIWRKVHHALDASRPRAVQQAAAMLGPEVGVSMKEVLDDPVRYVNRKAGTATRQAAELTAAALMRAASNAPEVAAVQLERFERQLPADLNAWVWATVGKQSALKLQPEASGYYERAAQAAARVPGGRVDLSDDMLGWQARAALRAAQGGPAALPRWTQVLQAIAAMSPAEQKDATWVYWKARALQALANEPREAAAAPARRAEARALLESIAAEMNFYGKLAASDLGRPTLVPPRPAELTAQERSGAVRHPGLDRAMQMFGLGLRSEAVREWNFSLRGMTDRELLASAQWACDREVWDRCINTSDKTRVEVDITQRYPMPFRSAVVARAREIDLDPAYVYGLIRQESRFIMDARSHVGASGLMQIMPETARWTARKIGIPFTSDAINDRDTNIKLGTSYLKLVLDDFHGSQAMGAAAYNAGPGRPRRWREGATLEPAVWAENIPFSETRDYVKKVLSNAVYYAARLDAENPSLKTRLGAPIGPRAGDAPVNKEIP